MMIPSADPTAAAAAAAVRVGPIRFRYLLFLLPFFGFVLDGKQGNQQAEGQAPRSDHKRDRVVHQKRHRNRRFLIVNDSFHTIYRAWVSVAFVVAVVV